MIESLSCSHFSKNNFPIEHNAYCWFSCQVKEIFFVQKFSGMFIINGCAILSNHFFAFIASMEIYKNVVIIFYSGDW